MVSSMEMPIIFYDLETFGLSPAHDRIAEFAGILTDDRLELMEQPYELRCLPPPDYIADPQACLTTGITPQAALQTGLPEPDFARRLHRWFTTHQRTLILGYNNASFDDEFVRHLFYRTFLDPYGWHHREGNRRMDIFAVIPGLFDFHRDLFRWPRTDAGLPDFRLEALAEANDALGGTSHEALADTFALRNLTKMIQERLPDVWDGLPGLLDKRAVVGRLTAALRAGPADPASVVVFSSARIRSVERCSSVYLVLGHETGPAGQWWLLNLDRDPAALLAQEPEQTAREWYTRDRPEEWRSLQRINPRRFPFVIPAGPRQYDLLDGYGLTRDIVETNRSTAVRAGVTAWAERFLRARDAVQAEAAVGDTERPRDVDAQLYDTLPSDEDRRVLAAGETASTAEIAALLSQVNLIDERNRELARRFVGRYLPERLSSDARQEFRAEAAQRLDIEQFDEVWRSELIAVRDGTTRSGLPVNRQVDVLRQLREHRNSLVRRMGLEARYGVLTEEPGR